MEEWVLEDCFRLRCVEGVEEASSDSVSLGIKEDFSAGEKENRGR